jgi:DNA mismatch repair protein MSH6
LLVLLFSAPKPLRASLTMVRGIEGNEMSTPRASQKKKPPPSASQSSKSQKSILGFFQKKSTNSPSPAPSPATTAKTTPQTSFSKKAFTKALSPQPSSDPALPSSPIKQEQNTSSGKNKENGLHSPVEYPGVEADRALLEVAGVAVSSPARKVLGSTHQVQLHALTIS